MEDDLVVGVLRRWRRAGIRFRAGDAAGVSEFERRYQLKLSDSLRTFFSLHDGMEQGESDENSIRFWPLREVRPASEDVPDGDPEAYRDYFIFADYSLWTHAYAVRLSGRYPDDVVIVGDSFPVSVASTFNEFLEMYLNDSSSLFGRT